MSDRWSLHMKREIVIGLGFSPARPPPGKALILPNHGLVSGRFAGGLSASCLGHGYVSFTTSQCRLIDPLG